MHFKYGDVLKRTRKYIGGSLVIAGITTMVLVGVTDVRQNKAHAAAGDFSFAVAGDYSGESSAGMATMDAIGATNPAFYFTTGDLDQGYDGGASGWCTEANSRINAPILLAPGNHDAEDGGSGYRITDYVPGGCAKPTVGTITAFSTSPDSYAQNYYFDYPATGPKVRILALSPALAINGGSTPTYDYSTGSALYNWVSQAIDTAKANGEWVIIGWHKPYINPGYGHSGDSGVGDPAHEADVFNLAVSKKVDIIINGHEHTYMRSKQLALGASCTAIQNKTYNAACIANAGSTGAYTRDAGTIEVINTAAWNAGARSFDSGDGGANFIATHAPSNTDGFMTFTVTDTSLTGNLLETSGSGFTDTFTITGSANPPADTTVPTVSLTAPTDGATVSGSTTLTATAVDNVGVTKVEFFYDNGIYIGESTASPYTISWDTTSAGGDGPHMLIAKAYDAAGNTATSSITVTVNNTTPPTGDTTPPTLSGFTATTPSSSLSIPITAFTASDAVGVTGYVITQSSTAPASSASEWSATEPSTYTVTGNGIYTLYPWAKDAAGNVSTVYGSPRTVTVNLPAGSDTTKPTVSITSPSAGNVHGTVSLTADANDNVGVTKVEYYYDGSVKIGESVTSPYTVSWNTTGIANAERMLMAKAYDAAGNVTLSNSVIVTVNNSTTTTTSPTSFTIKNIDDATKKSSVEISGTCIQSVAGTESTAPTSIKSAITGFAFTSNCTAAGGTATVTINLGTKYADLSKLHVYKEMSDKSIKDITTTSTIENKDVAGTTVTVVSYSVKDGDAGDLDGKADGKIVDPVYVTSAVAGSSTTLANTGTASQTIVGISLAITGLGIGLLTYKRTQIES